MKELDIIFSSLSRRLGITDSSQEAMAFDIAKLEILGLLMRLQSSPKQRPDSIVKVRRRRGGGDGAN